MLKEKYVIDSREIAAAAVAVGAFIASADGAYQCAEAALQAAARVRASDNQHRFTIKRRDGMDVVMMHEDKGDLVPGFDALGNRFEAYTSYFAWGDDRLYVQLDKRKIPAGADVALMRLIQDKMELEAAGFDTATIVDEN